MSDLPQRLRLNATIPLVMEAADHIEAMEVALRQIKIVCANIATLRHDLALEFVGGIANRALVPKLRVVAKNGDYSDQVACEAKDKG